MKYSQHTPELRQVRVAYIDERWHELAELQRDAGKTAATYLMVCNSGGAVTVLSFMGAMKTTTPFHTAPAMLLSFVLGIVLIGIGRAFAYYRVTVRYKRWREAVRRFYGDEWTWDQALAYDNAMGVTSVLSDVIGWSAFACFLAGVILGVFSL